MSREAVQILCRGLPHIPFAVGFGRSGPSQACPRTSWCATRNTSSEPEAEGGQRFGTGMEAHFEILGKRGGRKIAKS